MSMRDSFFNPGTNSAKKELAAHDTLKLSHADWIAVVEQMMASSGREVDFQASRHGRAEELGLLQITMRIEQPGGNTRPLIARCHDVGQDGMHFIHSHFIYPGSKAVCTMRSATRGSVQVSGFTANCKQISGAIHASWIKFVEQIEVGEFLTCVPEAIQS